MYGRRKGASFQELPRHALALTNLQPESSSSDKPKLERSLDFYGKGALIISSASTLEQVLATWSDLELGSRLLSLSKTLTARKRPTMDLKSTLLMFFVNYCLICLKRKHTISKCRPMAETNTFILNRNANFRENRLGNKRNVGNSGSPKRNRNPGKKPRWSSMPSRTNSLQHSNPMTQQSNKVYVLARLRRSHFCRLPPSHSHRETARKLKREDSRKASSGHNCEPSSLLGVPLSTNRQINVSIDRQI